VNSIKVYKLRDKNTGKFSPGGNYGQFTTEGKTWSSLKNLKSHLKMKYTTYDRETHEYVTRVPDYLEVLEGEFIPAGHVLMNAKDLF
jgi:hypothetical protein